MLPSHLLQNGMVMYYRGPRNKYAVCISMEAIDIRAWRQEGKTSEDRHKASARRTSAARSMSIFTPFN